MCSAIKFAKWIFGNILYYKTRFGEISHFIILSHKILAKVIKNGQLSRNGVPGWSRILRGEFDLFPNPNYMFATDEDVIKWLVGQGAIEKIVPRLWTSIGS